jgi:hypothetical protein
MLIFQDYSNFKVLNTNIWTKKKEIKINLISRNVNKTGFSTEN